MILDFKDIKKEDVLIAGGKGANLGEMTSAGINIPRGFVITADCYKAFLKENKIDVFISNKLDEIGKNEKLLLSSAKEFRARIRNGKYPPEIEKRIRDKYLEFGSLVSVAVRSSATAEDLPEASFAGQQETYLNVKGVEAVLDQVRNCYASLWGQRAVSYRFHQGYDQHSISIAVVIQEMVESETAGVLFTVNPVNKNPNEIQINASYGLGESVVSGRVTADSYIVNKSGKMIEIRIGAKETQIVYADKRVREEPVSDDKRTARALGDSEIARLAEAGLKIEKHYGMPMDIEWAIRDNNIYILQARAITTLKKSDDADRIVQKYIRKTRISGSMRKEMAFQLEKMPFAYRALDFDYMIAVNNQKAKIFAEGGIVFNTNPLIDEDGIQTLPYGKKRINKKIFNLLNMLKLFKNFQHCFRVCTRFMERYTREIERLKALDFPNMNLSECKEFMVYSHQFLEDLAYDRFKYALFPSVLLSNKFTKMIRRVDPNYSAFDFYWNLENKTALVAQDIVSLADRINQNPSLRQAILAGTNFTDLYTDFPEFRFLADNFIKDHGFKSDYNCYCIEAKTFIEDPDRLINILRPILNADNQDENTQSTHDFDALMSELKSIYGKKFDAIEKNINFFRYFHVVREETQYMWECLFYYVRECLKRINSILLNNEDYKHGVANLFHRELLDVLEMGTLNASSKEKIIRRNERFPLAMKVWDASKLLVFDVTGDVLKGVSGSTGKVIGKACVIAGPQEFYKMKKGDVLVCHLTDPEWTPLFKLASAVVADTGSALSHAAIVAREFKIPAVLGVGYATTKFKDGDTIIVDGHKGVVRGC